MIAALLLLKALAASGAGNGAVLLQPGLESLVMRLILHKQKMHVYSLALTEALKKLEQAPAI